MRENTKNNIVFALAFILAIALFFVSASGFSDNNIDGKLEKNVEVFIKFKDDGARGVNDISISARQEVADLIGKEKITHNFKNMVSASIDKDDLEKLKSSSKVDYVIPVGFKHIFLSVSVPLINGTKTWAMQQSGFNLTGAGQTICILDTGVNYSHSDLGGCFGNNNASSSCKVIGGHDFVNDDSNPLDDHGHGTHVAGIIAANGSINGVAPGAKIIAVKVCDSSGSCEDTDIIAGIEWCVDNSTMFNISVISMSLGADLYSTYCDGETNATAYVEPIGSAVAKNISVVIAAGNGLNNDAVGRSGQIAAPACVQNATPVSSTTDVDAISNFSNRYSNMSLFAPGSGIVSTSMAGSSQSRSGTSMATPHVSGAIAILNQYLRLSGQTRTPRQAELALNSTGKMINDTETGIWYSRIDVYAAMISMDNRVPNITLVSPSNGTASANVNYTFRCNATDISLKNVTFYLWNSSGVYNQTSQSVNGSGYSFEINITNIKSASYLWNCLYYDEHHNGTFASGNYSASFGAPVVNLTLPANNIVTSTNRTFVCNATSINETLTNATFYVWNSSHTLQYNVSADVSGLAGGATFVYYNFTREGNYTWNCLFANDQNVKSFASVNYSAIYDLTPPTFSITSPVNGSYYNAARLNISLSENGSCMYSLNAGLANVSMSSSDNRNFTATNSTLAQMNNYNATFYCNDSAGNKNSSSMIYFNVDLTAPNISVVAPLPADETASSASKIFYYNVTDNLNISGCSLVLNGAISSTNSSITNASLNYNFTQTLDAGGYSWSVNCTDIASNVGNSSTESFTITATSTPPSSGGGGGSGTTSATYIPSQSQMVQGYTRTLSKNDKIKFGVYSGAGTENHTLLVNAVTSNSVNLTIQSAIVKLTLALGQSAKLNLTSASAYDLFVQLNNITGTKASITLREINESIPATTKPVARNQSIVNVPVVNESAGDSESEGSSSYMKYAAIIAILVIIAFIAIRYRKKGGEKTEIDIKRMKNLK